MDLQGNKLIGIQERHRRTASRRRVSRKSNRYDRDSVRAQDFFCLDRIEPGPTCTQHAGYNAARYCGIRREIFRKAWWRLHQHVERFAVAHQVTVARDCTVFGWIVRNSYCLEF